MEGSFCWFKAQDLAIPDLLSLHKACAKESRRQQQEIKKAR